MARLCPSCQGALTGPEWSCGQCGWRAERTDRIVLLAPEIADGLADFPAEDHDLLVQVEENHFWFQARDDLIAWAIQAFFSRAANFFELGCGTGRFLRYLAARRLDLDLCGGEALTSPLRTAAVAAPRAELVQLDARRLPFREEFDLAGAFDVLEHLEDDQTVLNALARALRPGGGLILTVPHHPWLWSPQDELGGHKRRYTRAELRAKAAQAGLRIIKMTAFMGFILPLTWASKMRIRLSSSQKSRHAVMSQVRPTRALNSLCRSLCGLERRCLRRGHDLPLGSSLLCLAIK